MSELLDTLVNRVAAIESAGDSAIALLNGLREKLDAAIASGDMSVVQELSDRLAVQTQELADAVTANTVEKLPVMEGADPE